MVSCLLFAWWCQTQDLTHTQQELPLRHMPAPSHPYCVHPRWQSCCGGAFKFYWSVFLYWLCWWFPCYWFVFILITLVGFPVSICSLYTVLGFNSFLQAVPTQPLNFSVPSVSYSSLRHVQPTAYGHMHSGIGLSAAQPKTVNLLKMCLVCVCFCSLLSQSCVWLCRWHHHVASGHSTCFFHVIYTEWFYVSM